MLRLSSGNPYHDGEASPISTLTPTAQPMIGTERLRPGINVAPDGCSSTFNTVHGKYCRFIYMYHHDTDRNTTGLCVTFVGAVNWKSRQLKPTAQSATEFGNWPMIDASNGTSGRLGGAWGIAWFGFCLLSSFFCLLFVFGLFFNGLVLDGRDNALGEC
jgi:hypothetical protein